MASGARTRGRRGRGSVDLSICDRWDRLDYLELASDVRHDEHAMMIRLLVVSALSASAVCTSALAVSPAASQVEGGGAHQRTTLLLLTAHLRTSSTFRLTLADGSLSHRDTAESSVVVDVHASSQQALVSAAWRTDLIVGALADMLTRSIVPRTYAIRLPTVSGRRAATSTGLGPSRYRNTPATSRSVVRRIVLRNAQQANLKFVSMEFLRAKNDAVVLRLRTSSPRAYVAQRQKLLAVLDRGLVGPTNPTVDGLEILVTDRGGRIVDESAFATRLQSGYGWTRRS